MDSTPEGREPVPTLLVLYNLRHTKLQTNG